MRFLLLLVLVSVTAPKMNTPKIQAPAPTPAQSERLKDLSSRENSLNTQRNDFNARENLWHNAYIWLGVCSLVLGGFSVLFQRLETRNVRSGRRVADDLTAVRDERHEIEKQIADFAIASAQTVASQAIDDSAKAFDSAGEANERAGLLEKEASEQRERAAKLEHDAEELRKQNDATEAKLEGEKVKRVRLAVSLLPRQFLDQSGAIERIQSLNLKPHRVLLKYLDEAEPREFAGQIAFVFAQLRWPFSGKRLHGTPTDPGVTVGPGSKVLAEMSKIIELEKTEAVAVAVSGILSEVGIDSKYTLNAADPDEDPSTLVIVVGANPNRELYEALHELGGPEIIKRGHPNLTRNWVNIPDEPAPAQNNQ